MLGKYTTTIWNLLCISGIALSVKLLTPYIQKQEAPPPPVEEVSPIRQIGTKRTLWKRGKMACTTIVNENKSTSNTGKQKAHSSDDWMSITWSKKQ